MIHIPLEKIGLSSSHADGRGICQPSHSTKIGSRQSECVPTYVSCQLIHIPIPKGVLSNPILQGIKQIISETDV